MSKRPRFNRCETELIFLIILVVFEQRANLRFLHEVVEIFQYPVSVAKFEPLARNFIMLGNLELVKKEISLLDNQEVVVDSEIFPILPNFDVSQNLLGNFGTVF